jgi:hypothetical protein
MNSIRRSQSPHLSVQTPQVLVFFTGQHLMSEYEVRLVVCSYVFSECQHTENREKDACVQMRLSKSGVGAAARQCSS